MTVRFYSSADVGAPALRGNVAGDIINVLSKCLVEGYGSKTAAGWSKPFTGSGVAVFRQGSGFNGMYLRVDESAAASPYYEARIVAYESMSDVNTGNGMFPTTAQQSGGLKWFKHYTGDASAARDWVVIADEGFFIINWRTYPVANVGEQYRQTYWFGDINPSGPADTYGTVVYGDTASGSPNSSESKPFDSVSITTRYNGLYAARSYTGLGGSVELGQSHDARKSGTDVWGGNSYLPYPHGPDGALLLSEIWTHQPSSQIGSAAIRGTYPGMWAPLQFVLTQGDTFQGQGDLAGRSFYCLRHGDARVVVETSDTWR